MGTVTLRWVESHLMVTSDSNGHSVVVGKLPEGEQPWGGVKPSDLLLMAVASCTAWDVLDILLKQRTLLRDFKITCHGDQQSNPPYTFTRIHLHYLVDGDIDRGKLQRAIQLSEEKYCSVISTLRPDVPITSDFEILSSQS